ncbi:MAG: hypothetical protein ACRCTM_14715, partial [Sphaerotilus sulfidivorans]
MFITLMPQASCNAPNFFLERVHDPDCPENAGMPTRKSYASDISRERFAEIEPLLRGVRRRTKP